MPDSPSEPRAPLAPRHPQRIVAHGETRVDDYFWLRDRDSEAVLDYLRAENAYTETCMQSTDGLQQTLYREFRGRIKEDDESVPVRIDDFWYHTRTEADREYPVFCRAPAAEPSAIEVILDINKLAEGHDFYDVGGVAVSPDHRYLAYTEDTEGSERFTLRVRDLSTGEDGPEAIGNVSGGVEWAEDGRHLLYVVLDEARRPYRVFVHERGGPAAADREIHNEADDAFFVGLGKTKDRRYLLIEIGSNVTSEARYMPALRPTEPPAIVRPRAHGVEYGVEHHSGSFFILHNAGAENFQLDRVPVERCTEDAAWRTYVPHDETVKLEDLEVFRGHLALVVREEATRRIRVYDLDDGRYHELPFEETVYTAGLGDNPEFESSTLRIGYTSLVTPDCVYDYDMAARRLTLRKQREIPSGYDAGLYVGERHWFNAPDGTAVPVSLVRRHDTPVDGSAPCLLFGYGAYGITVDPTFSANRVSLLDRGLVYAIAHVRGGGALGEGWKNAGKLERKPNTFSDFIACAEGLIESGYTRPERLAIMGGSAGGMLIGAVLNQRPELFQVAVAQVPFVDVLNTMEDPSLPLTVIEYDEWGNPRERGWYELIRDYAPYENVRPQRYPHLLVVAGLNDPRVQYWEPAKWVARLRRTKTDDNLLLLRTHMDSGHMGASGRFRALRELAFDMAFVLDRLGITE
ncbi:S9 family peptidase [Ectothiorhodospiraceae bacterium WFHF3C12]|nr:S9 family peptidase [Ectothiorhodospiraceae bacterium WFHF3C12]